MAEVRVEVSYEDLQVLFDTAVGSLNFTSGFLDSDEVQVLRRFAVVLGVDPMVGTPRTFAWQYPHAFKPHHYLADESEFFRKQGVDKCDWCSHPEGLHPDQMRMQYNDLPRWRFGA